MRPVGRARDASPRGNPRGRRMWRLQVMLAAVY